MSHASEAWAVWNDCNGPFEVFWRRAEALKAIEGRYYTCGATAVPVLVALDKNVDERSYREDVEEAVRARSRALLRDMGGVRASK